MIDTKGKGGVMAFSFKPVCGSCTHYDQTGNSWMKWCDVHKCYKYINDHCDRYDDLWEQDMFGHFYKYEKMKKEGKAE